MTLADLKRRYLAGTLSKPDYIAKAFERHEALFEYAALLGATDVERLEISAGKVVATLKPWGIRMRVPEGDIRSIPVDALNFGAFEAVERDLMLEVLRLLDAKTLFDVGANHGYYALQFVRALPTLQVHAFEPVPQTRATLDENLAMNGAGARVTVHQLGLGDAPGQLRFYVPREMSVNASAANVGDRPDALVVECEVTTVDAFVAKTGTRPDFIKCDVEGFELQVFQGAKATLASARPAVFAEMLRKWSARFDYHPNDIISLFDALGYACFALGRGGVRPFTRMTDETEETNFFFLHPDTHRRCIAALTGGA